MKFKSFATCLLIHVLFFNFNSVAEDPCAKLNVNLKKGELNGLKPTASQEKIREVFPCFTGSSEERSIFNCGGGVFFLDHDFYFYTGRDFLEIRDDFNGRIKGEWMGMSLFTLTTDFGNPVREEKLGNKEIYFFETKYGCVRFILVNDKIVEIGIHYQPADKVELCM